jgi:two-component system, NtrC family, nitrogen regulation response regulator GlnG
LTPRNLGRLWAVSPSMQTVLDRIVEIAPSDASIIIEGETGTGKELVAEAIHQHSARAERPYVVVDCAAIPRDLIESEMFGHAKGAFTGATADRRGAFEDGDGGTIFIDEIGELPLDLQPRLLRVLEKQEVRRVGTNTVTTVDVRIISATNRDLKREVEEGRFREDLFFRLNVVSVRLPPLRERPEDIFFFAEQWLPPGIQIREETKQRLLDYAWPGNVRELRNVIDRGAALSDKDFRLPEDFGKVAFDDIHLLPTADLPLLGVGDVTRPLWTGKTFKEAKDAVIADFEQGYIIDLLDQHQGNVSAAARAAGIHRNILHRMMARYGITR